MGFGLFGKLPQNRDFISKLRSYWWTAGTERMGPVLYVREGLPEPDFYTLMLTPVADW